MSFLCSEARYCSTAFFTVAYFSGFCFLQRDACLHIHMVKHFRFNISRFFPSTISFIPSFNHSSVSLIVVSTQFSAKSTQFPVKNREQIHKNTSVKMAKTGVSAHEIRAQNHENRAFFRGRLSENRCLSHATVIAFYFINIYISLSFSML